MVKLLFNKRLKFESVEQENDELIRAIDSYAERQDDRWNLSEDGSSENSADMWDEALSDTEDINVEGTPD